MHRDSFSLSNYLCSAQTLPEAPLQLYCSHLYRTNTDVNRLNEKGIFYTYNSDCRTSLMAQLWLFTGWRRDLLQPLTGRQNLAVGKCVIPTLSPCLLVLCSSSSCSQQEQISPSFLCHPKDHVLTAAYQESLLRNHLPRASHSQNWCLKMAGLSNSVLCQSGEGTPAAKLFCLWSLHGTGRYKLGTDHQTSQQVLLPCCWEWGLKEQEHSTRTLGWWGGLATYCPEGNMAELSTKSRLSYQWSMCCWSKLHLLSLFEDRIGALGICASCHKYVLLGNW